MDFPAKTLASNTCAVQHVLRTVLEQAGFASSVPGVRHQDKVVTPFRKYGCDGFGREEMSARATGGDNDGAVHGAFLSNSGPWP
ncbi:hypothetical protein GOX01_12140 [Gluconobacter oxydans]|nr:hypothetical protein GOX01_12140 [Gluconobacter oxydans]